jgi:hypothetical protein
MDSLLFGYHEGVHSDAYLNQVKIMRIPGAYAEEGVSNSLFHSTAQALKIGLVLLNVRDNSSYVFLPESVLELGDPSLNCVSLLLWYQADAGVVGSAYHYNVLQVQVGCMDKLILVLGKSVCRGLFLGNLISFWTLFS